MKIIHLSKAQLNVEAIFKVLETGDDVLLKSLSPNTPSSMPGRPVTFPDRSAFERGHPRVNWPISPLSNHFETVNGIETLSGRKVFWRTHTKSVN